MFTSIKRTVAAALVASPITFTAGVGNALAGEDDLEPIEALGKKIFFDEQLSLRKNQACACCP